jgi:hypothetical protein
MAIYSTFFLAKPRDLGRGFPGWKPPLPKPVQRTFKNPFTGEVKTIESTAPEWPDEDDGWSRAPQVVGITGDYEDYLEGRVPRFVRDRPHWCAKGLTEVELKPLGQALDIEPALATALYGPPPAGAIIDRIRPELVSALESLEKNEVKAVARRWAATMSSRDFTHSVTGNRISDGWRVGDALDILEPLIDLARERAEGEFMYLLVEC